MKRNFLLLVFILVSAGTYAQTEKGHYLGMNILQLPASTFNINYSLDLFPRFTPLLEIGYAINHVKVENVDLAGWVLTSHYKEDFGRDRPWVDYRADKQSGGYLKLGGYFNFRKSNEQQHFFHVGLFLTNSIVYEHAWEAVIYPVAYEPTPVSQTLYIVGLNCAAGYEFLITKRLKSDLDLQVSLPDKNYRDLYGYRNFIPGMGFKDNENRWFPMLIWNLKYRL